MQDKYVWCDCNIDDDEVSGWHKVVGDKLEEISPRSVGSFVFVPFNRVELRDYIVYETCPEGKTYEEWTGEDWAEWFEEIGYCLFEKKFWEPKEEYKPSKEGRLAWLIDFIRDVEEDRAAAPTRLNALYTGQMINTEINSFVIRRCDYDSTEN